MLLCRHKELYDIYQKIVDNREEQQLVELIKSGELKTDQRNAEG